MPWNFSEAFFFLDDLIEERSKEKLFENGYKLLFAKQNRCVKFSSCNIVALFLPSFLNDILKQEF